MIMGKFISNNVLLYTFYENTFVILGAIITINISVEDCMYVYGTIFAHYYY